MVSSSLAIKKRFFNRETIRFKRISPLLAESLFTLSGLAEILELRREGGMKDIWRILLFNAAIVSLL